MPGRVFTLLYTVLFSIMKYSKYKEKETILQQTAKSTSTFYHTNGFKTNSTANSLEARHVSRVSPEEREFHLIF